MYLCLAMSEEQNQLDLKVLARIIGLARPYKVIFFIAAVLAIVLAPIGVIRPYLINVMVDDYILQGNYGGMMNIAMIFIAVLILNVILQYAFIYITNLLGQSVIRDLRTKIFNHIVSLRSAYFDKTPIGQATTRTINDIETINQVFTQGVITMIADILGLIAVLIIMFTTSFRLSMICMISVPLLIIATYIFKEKVKVAFQKVRTQISTMNAFLQERITGMKVVQIFNAEQQERQKFKTINRSYTRANLDAVNYYAIFFPVVEIISAFSLGIMVWWGAQSVLTDEVSLGALIVFPIYLGMMFRPIRLLADKFNTIQMGIVAADRVFGVIDDDDKVQNNGDLVKDDFQGKLEFKNVKFAYVENQYVLHNLNFKLQPGETLAIVGSTGSGKTTIINLLNKFYEINEGEILIDDVSLEKYNLDFVRSRMAIVLQDVFLFTGSILDNISLMDDRIKKEKVVEAAKMIGADVFIENLPGGYDFVVTERGLNLSVGQRQLISFVRALVFDPDILILDEATSSIDTETESIIQHAIETLINKRTSIIIAHRLSTIRNANYIMVLDKGNKVEFGNHDELVQIKDGYYKKLYDMQFSEMHNHS